jgi:hypothetical protein
LLKLNQFLSFAYRFEPSSQRSKSFSPFRALAFFGWRQHLEPFGSLEKRSFYDCPGFVSIAPHIEQFF